MNCLSSFLCKSQLEIYLQLPWPASHHSTLWSHICHSAQCCLYVTHPRFCAFRVFLGVATVSSLLVLSSGLNVLCSISCFSEAGTHTFESVPLFWGSSPCVFEYNESTNGHISSSFSSDKLWGDEVRTACRVQPFSEKIGNSPP